MSEQGHRGAKISIVLKLILFIKSNEKTGTIWQQMPIPMTQFQKGLALKHCY